MNRHPLPRFTGLLLLLAAAAAPGLAGADFLFVSTLEADGYRQVAYSLAAFGSLSGFPDAGRRFSAWLDRAMAVPGRAGIAVNKPFRIITAIDVDKPVSPENPATIAILPLAGREQAVTAALSARYAKKEPLFFCNGALFSRPADTNAPPAAAVAFEKKHALAASGAPALRWAWKNRDQLIGAPPQDIAGTFRLLVNARRFADLTPVRYPELRNIPHLWKRMDDFDTLLFAVDLDGRKAALTLRGTPGKETVLGRLARAWQPPGEKAWRALPPDAFFAALAGSKPPTFLRTFFDPLYAYLLSPAGLAPPEAWQGDHFSCLIPSSGKAGLLLARMDPLAPDSARRIAQKLSGLAAAPGRPQALDLTPLPPRKTAAGNTVARYRTAFRKAKPGEESQMRTLLSLFLKSAVWELAVENGALISALGPDEPLVEQALQAFAPKSTPYTPDRRVKMNLPALSAAPLTAAAACRPSRLIRHIVSLIPDIAPDQMQALSSGSGGIFELGIAADPRSGALTLSIRADVDEIAALQKTARDIRPIMQQLLLMMFTRQLTPETGDANDKSPR